MSTINNALTIIPKFDGISSPKEAAIKPIFRRSELPLITIGDLSSIAENIDEALLLHDAKSTDLHEMNELEELFGVDAYDLMDEVSAWSTYKQVSDEREEQEEKRKRREYEAVVGLDDNEIFNSLLKMILETFDEQYSKHKENNFKGFHKLRLEISERLSDIKRFYAYGGENHQKQHIEYPSLVDALFMLKDLAQSLKLKSILELPIFQKLPEA